MVKKSAIKNIIMFTSVFLGSSLFASDIQKDFSTSYRVNKRISYKSSIPEGTVYIIIDKSDYELNVYDDKGCQKPLIIVECKKQDVQYKKILKRRGKGEKNIE